MRLYAVLLFKIERKLYASLPDLLTKVAREEIVKLPQIPKCQVAYLPLVKI